MSEIKQDIEGEKERDLVGDIQLAFDTMMRDWHMMQSGSMDDQDANEDNAERFETNFHRLVKVIFQWYHALADPPQSVEELQAIEPIQSIMEELPPPLLIPFETELEYIADGNERIADEKYD